MSTLPRGLGRSIQDHRVTAGLPREQLALQVGRTAGTVANWERGRVIPPPGVMLRIAEALGCSFAELAGDE